MSTTYSDFLYKELSYQIIGAAFRIHTKLGSGLPEYCYERSLMLEFESLGIPCIEQQRYEVHYNDTFVGHFIADLIVDNRIILELKSEERLIKPFEVQLFTYLRTSGLKVGYVLNFGSKSLQFKRLIL